MEHFVNFLSISCCRREYDFLIRCRRIRPPQRGDWKNGQRCDNCSRSRGSVDPRRAAQGWSAAGQCGCDPEKIFFTGRGEQAGCHCSRFQHLAAFEHRHDPDDTPSLYCSDPRRLQSCTDAGERVSDRRCSRLYYRPGRPTRPQPGGSTNSSGQGQ